MEDFAAFGAQLWAIAWPLYGAWRAAGRLAAQAELAERVVITAILFLSACVCINELLGSAGLLSPLPMLVAYSAVGALGAVWARALPRVAIPWQAALPASPLGYLTLGAVLLALPHALRGLVLVPVAWDELSYHLLKPALWIIDAELNRPAFPYPVSFLAYYPANGELVWTTLIGISHSDLFLHVLNFPLLCVLALQFVQFSRALGGSRSASWSFALVLVTLPVVLGFAQTAYVECVLNVSELAAIWFALRWLRAERDHARVPAVLCGLASGLALGAKYSALPVVAALLFAVFVALLARGRRHGVIIEAALAGCAALVTGAYWYVRNALETGNPFYPVPFLGLPYGEKWTHPWYGYSVLENFMALVRSGDLWRAWFVRIPANGYVAGAGLGWFGCVLLVIASLGAGSMIASMLRRPSAEPSVSRADAGLILVAVLATLFTYLRLPYWSKVGWIVSQVRFMTPFVCIGVASGLPLLERWVGVRALYALAAVGLVLNASQLNLRYPQLTASQSLAVLAVSGALGGVLVWRAKARMWLVPAFAALSLAGLLAIAPWRERHRFELLRDHVVLHASRHAPLVAAAEYLARNFAHTKVAVVMDRFEFLSVFTGRGFQIRPIYVLTHAGPAAPSNYLDGDPRHEWKREVWLRNLRDSGAAALIITNIEPNGAWEAEREWIEQAGYRPLEFGPVLVYDLR